MMDHSIRRWVTIGIFVLWFLVGWFASSLFHTAKTRILGGQGAGNPIGLPSPASVHPIRIPIVDPTAP